MRYGSDNSPKSVRCPIGAEMYADLVGNHKKQGIKSLCDNIVTKSWGGIVRENNIVRLTADVDICVLPLKITWRKFKVYSKKS